MSADDPVPARLQPSAQLRTRPSPQRVARALPTCLHRERFPDEADGRGGVLLAHDGLREAAQDQADIRHGSRRSQHACRAAPGNACHTPVKDLPQPARIDGKVRHQTKAPRRSLSHLRALRAIASKRTVSVEGTVSTTVLEVKPRSASTEYESMTSTSLNPAAFISASSSSSGRAA